MKLYLVAKPVMLVKFKSSCISLEIDSFYSLKLSLDHCIVLLFGLIIGKVLFSYCWYVHRHCCPG